MMRWVLLQHVRRCHWLCKLYPVFGFRDSLYQVLSSIRYICQSCVCNLFPRSFNQILCVNFSCLL